MTSQSPDISAYVSSDVIDQIIAMAKTEDLGPHALDVTSELMIPAEQRATAMIRSRKPGIIAGLSLLPNIIQAYDPSLQLTLYAADGQRVSMGQTLAEIHGPLRSILACERIMLNFLGRLSGIATLTSVYVSRCEQTSARIYDTRKTTPAWRGLEKFAVACGGGGTHRMGLYDAVLIKDNHLARQPGSSLTEKLTQVVQSARDRFPSLKFIMLEADRLDQVQAGLDAQADIILLDNMGYHDMEEACEMRDAAEIKPSQSRIELEASGGISIETIRKVAETGVDRISVGALTHSAPNLDVGMDIESDGGHA